MKKSADVWKEFVLHDWRQTLKGSLSVRNSIPGISRSQTGSPLHVSKHQPSPKRSLFYTQKDFKNSDDGLLQSHCLLDVGFCLLGSFSGDVQTNVVKILQAACSTLQPLLDTQRAFVLVLPNADTLPSEYTTIFTFLPLVEPPSMKNRSRGMEVQFWSPNWTSPKPQSWWDCSFGEKHTDTDYQYAATRVLQHSSSAQDVRTPW